MEVPSLNDETIASGVKWAIGTVGIILSALGAFLGVNKLAEVRMKRRYLEKDKANEIHETNQGKAIDADKDAFVIVAKRLEIIEVRCDKIQDDLTEQKATNSTLMADNKHLQKENAAQEHEIKDLQNRLRVANETIAELRRELDILKMRFDGASPLPVQIIEGE